MDFTILAVVLLIGVGIPVRNKLIRKYREEKKKLSAIYLTQNLIQAAM